MKNLLLIAVACLISIASFSQSIGVNNKVHRTKTKAPSPSTAFNKAGAPRRIVVSRGSSRFYESKHQSLIRNKRARKERDKAFAGRM